MFWKPNISSLGHEGNNSVYINSQGNVFPLTSADIHVPGFVCLLIDIGASLFLFLSNKMFWKAIFVLYNVNIFFFFWLLKQKTLDGTVEELRANVWTSKRPDQKITVMQQKYQRRQVSLVQRQNRIRDVSGAVVQHGVAKLWAGPVYCLVRSVHLVCFRFDAWTTGTHTVFEDMVYFVNLITVCLTICYIGRINRSTIKDKGHVKPCDTTTRVPPLQ